MKRIKNLTDAQKYIGSVIDGNKIAVDFGGHVAGKDNELHTDLDTQKLYWRGEEIVTGTAYILPPATHETLGGVMKGDRITIDPNGVISADQLWSEMQGERPGVSHFENDMDYRNTDQVENQITERIAGLDWVQDVEYDEDTGDVTVTFKDREEYKFRVPALDIIDDIDYDPDTKELILIKKDKSELRIDLSDLVDIYEGHVGDEIQIVVDGNVIKAILLNGVVNEAHLHYELAAKINAKIDKVDGAIPGNIAIFKTDGSIEDSGEGLDDFVRKVDDLETEIGIHNHDGENSARVNYNNLLERPVILFEMDNHAPGSQTWDFGTNLYNVEYVVTRGAEYQTGVLKVRYEDIMEMDVFGADTDVVFTIDGTGRLTVTNNGSTNFDVKLLVFFFSIGKLSFNGNYFDGSFETHKHLG
jgi:hypothetical protein